MTAAHRFGEHTGELAISLEADSLSALFVEAGRALAEVMSGAVPAGKGDFVRVRLEARDRDALLVAWIDELVFLAERDKKIFGELRIERLSDRELEASVRGRPVSALNTAVKAATFHGLHITDGPNGVAATVILDV